MYSDTKDALTKSIANYKVTYYRQENRNNDAKSYYTVAENKSCFRNSVVENYVECVSGTLYRYSFRGMWYKKTYDNADTVGEWAWNKNSYNALPLCEENDARFNGYTGSKYLGNGRYSYTVNYEKTDDPFWDSFATLSDYQIVFTENSGLITRVEHRTRLGIVDMGSVVYEIEYGGQAVALPAAFTPAPPVGTPTNLQITDGILTWIQSDLTDVSGYNLLIKPNGGEIITVGIYAYWYDLSCNLSPIFANCRLNEGEYEVCVVATSIYETTNDSEPSEPIAFLYSR